MKKNYNMEWVTVNGYKCLKVTGVTCHTDEGPMYWGYNTSDDTASSTLKIGRRRYNNIMDKLFPNGYKNIFQVVSCEKDEKWAKKHKNMLGDREDACYVVTSEALVFPIEMSDEIENKHGGRWCWDLHKEETWREFNDIYVQAFGHGLTFLPHCGGFHKDSFEAKLAMENTGLTWDEICSLDHIV